MEEKEQQLIDSYRRLDKSGKRAAREMMEALAYSSAAARSFSMRSSAYGCSSSGSDLNAESSVLSSGVNLL